MSDSNPQPPLPPQSPAEQPPTPPAGPTPDERNMGMLAHLLVFSGSFIPFGNILGPLVIYLTKKDESTYVRHHSAEALNFQISMTIYIIVSVILCFILIGIPILIALVIMDIVYTIIAAVKASNGIQYRYPLTIRFMS